jgi:septum site-determining protein MinC
MRFICRSYMALVLAPEPPIQEWLAAIDQKVTETGSFFAGWPVVLDLSGVTLSNTAIAHLVTELEKRGIRTMGIENVDSTQAGENVPPVVRSSKAPATEADFSAPPLRKTNQEQTTLLVDQPIRSGQTVVFMEGDVTVLGSVGSGAELVAGGSIHIYGTLRGRAMAGSNGNTQARIFCSKIEAELLAINGYYLTADSLDRSLRDRPTQIWLEGNALKIAALE